MSTTPNIDDAPLCVQVQLWLVEYLKTRESLVRGASRVPVIGRRVTNIANDIEAALSELGACIYVLPMLPVRFNVNVPGPHIDRAEVRIRCIETDTTNTTLPNVFELVEAVAREVSHLQIPLATHLYLAPDEDRPVQERPDAERLIYDVVFTTTATYPARIEEQ